MSCFQTEKPRERHKKEIITWRNSDSKETSGLSCDQVFLSLDSTFRAIPKEKKQSSTVSGYFREHLKFCDTPKFSAGISKNDLNMQPEFSELFS